MPSKEFEKKWIIERLDNRPIDVGRDPVNLL